MSESNENGFGLCANCLSGFEIPGQPQGIEERVGPFNTYIAKPTTPAPGKEDTVLLFLPDAFGLNLVNNKILPDKFAEKLGITVYSVDYFHGKGLDPAFADAMPSTATEAKSQGLLKKISMVGKMASVAPWMISNRPSSKYADFDRFLKTLREEKGVKKIGAIGYCFGGHFVLKYNAEFDASVACHPSLWQMDWIEKATKPVCFCFCEVDQMVSDAQREQIVAILDRKKGELESEWKLYENTVHGSMARPNLADPKVKAAFEGAFAQAVTFYQKHLLGGGTAAAPAAAPAASHETAPAASVTV